MLKQKGAHLIVLAHEVGADLKSSPKFCIYMCNFFLCFLNLDLIEMYLSEVPHPVGVLLREEEVVRADLAGHAEAALLGQADHLEKNWKCGRCKSKI